MQSYNKDIDDFLAAVCEQIRFKSLHRSIKNELLDHIACLKNEYISDGMDDEAAALKALEQMGDPVLVGKQLNQAHKTKTEWVVLSISLILVTIGGAVQLFLSGISPNNANAFSRFLLYAPFGIAAFGAAYFYDYMMLGRHSRLIYFSLIAASILGFLCFGTIRGAYRHVYYLVFLFIPAFSGVIYSLRNRGYIGIIISGLFYAGAAIICLMAPTLSGLLFLTAACLIVLTAAICKGYFGSSKKIGLALVYIPTIIITVLAILTLSGYKAKRFKFILHPEADPQGCGYLHLMVRRLISSSQPFGKAVLDGNMSGMSIHRVLPGWQTDFSLTYVISSLGYIAGLGIVAIMLLLIIRMFRLVAKQKNAFGYLLSLSCCIAITGQIVLYILSNIGILIPVGSILPFISYGGTGFAVDMILLGLLLSVYRRTNLVNDKLISDNCDRKLLTLVDGKLIIDLGIKK